MHNCQLRNHCSWRQAYSTVTSEPTIGGSWDALTAHFSVVSFPKLCSSGHGVQRRQSQTCIWWPPGRRWWCTLKLPKANNSGGTLPAAQAAAVAVVTLLSPGHRVRMSGTVGIKGAEPGPPPHFSAHMWSPGKAQGRAAWLTTRGWPSIQHWKGSQKQQAGGWVWERRHIFSWLSACKAKSNCFKLTKSQHLTESEWF